MNIVPLTKARHASTREVVNTGGNPDRIISQGAMEIIAMTAQKPTAQMAESATINSYTAEILAVNSENEKDPVRWQAAYRIHVHGRVHGDWFRRRESKASTVASAADSVGTDHRDLAKRYPRRAGTFAGTGPVHICRSGRGGSETRTASV